MSLPRLLCVFTTPPQNCARTLPTVAKSSVVVRPPSSDQVPVSVEKAHMSDRRPGCASPNTNPLPPYSHSFRPWEWCVRGCVCVCVWVNRR